MAGKWVSAAAGFLLLVGCMVGISVLVFQEDASSGAYKSRNEESMKGSEARQGQDGGSGGTHLHGLRKTESELNSLADELEKLFTKSQGRPGGSSLGSKRNLTLKLSPSTSSPTTPTQGPPLELGTTRARAVVPDQSTPAWRHASFQVGPHQSRRLFPTAGLEPIVSPGPAEEEWTEPDLGEDYEEDGEGAEPDEGADGLELDSLFDLASNLYGTGVNSSDFQGFLRVLNDTVHRGNESGLLTRLNELYSRPETPSSLGGSIGAGRNAYESSLTAFVFMSFGVFLLNQIHGLIGKESPEEGRALGISPVQDSQLDLLFHPPLSQALSGEPKSSEEGRRSPYVNNMFRALLNLVNAYTKDSEVLECIWSLYCQDLDKTSASEGLYGIAARINSIGLRLIMHQISAELTMDLLLRSMLGWDGLPCTKMFPKCQVEKATARLRAATSGPAAHLNDK